MPDGYELEPPPGHERPIEHDDWRPRPPRGGGVLPILLALVLLAAGGVAVYFVFFRAQPAPVAPAVAEAPRPLATPTPVRGPMPALDESDAFIRQLAAALSAHPEVARWLARTSLVRTLTSVVSSINTGETPRRELEFLAPKQRFRAGGKKGAPRITADPASYTGYDLFGDAVASIDAGAAASAYHASEPLWDAAYLDIGFPGGFRPALDGAIRELLAVPIAPADAELVPHERGGFAWANPELEALTAAQKQFLRTGPRNVRLVQAKLRELQAALR